MRGKQCAGTVPISLSGITPADAGKTTGKQSEHEI